jgi:hypothetical protein
MGEALPSENFFFLTIFSFETMAALAILVATVKRESQMKSGRWTRRCPFSWEREGD